MSGLGVALSLLPPTPVHMPPLALIVPSPPGIALGTWICAVARANVGTNTPPISAGPPQFGSHTLVVVGVQWQRKHGIPVWETVGPKLTGSSLALDFTNRRGLVAPLSQCAYAPGFFAGSGRNP